MKTNITKTIAALLGSALLLGNSVLAGPGPQVQYHTNPAPTAQSKAQKGSAKDNQRKARVVYTPHGDVMVVF